jgi:hypothetical protein
LIICSSSPSGVQIKRRLPYFLDSLFNFQTRNCVKIQASFAYVTLYETVSSGPFLKNTKTVIQKAKEKVETFEPTINISV